MDPDLAQLESAATPGPWEAVPERYLARGDWGIFAPGGRVIATVPVNLVLRANEAERKQFAADAALIVAARNELPQLLTELTRLRAIEVASIAAEQRVKELEGCLFSVTATASDVVERFAELGRPLGLDYVINRLDLDLNVAERIARQRPIRPQEVSDE